MNKILCSSLIACYLIISCERVEVINTCNLSGQIISSETNEPVVGVTVKVDEFSDISRSSGGDLDSGMYEFPAIPLGMRTLSASKDGYFDYEDTIEIIGDTLIYDFEMDSDSPLIDNTCNLSGMIISSETNMPIAGVIVEVEEFSDTSRSNGSDLEVGRYELPSVPFGRYRLLASTVGYQDYEAVIEIFEDRVVYNFELEPPLPNPLWREVNYSGGSINALCSTSENQLIVGSDSGIYVSQDIDDAVWLRTLNQPIYSIHTRSNSSILAVGEDLYESTDNGESWVLLDTLFQGYKGVSITATSTERILMSVVDDSRMGMSFFSDDGQEWEEMNIYYPAFGPPKFFIGPTIIFAVHNYDSDADIFYSNNNGETWNPTQKSNFQAFTTSIGFGGTSSVFLVEGVFSGISRLYRSYDLGVTWEHGSPLSRREPSDPVYVCASNSGTLYVAGNVFSILKSKDQGETWIAFDGGLPAMDYRELYIGSNNYLYAFATVGNINTLWKTIITVE